MVELITDEGKLCLKGDLYNYSNEIPIANIEFSNEWHTGQLESLVTQNNSVIATYQMDSQLLTVSIEWKYNDNFWAQDIEECVTIRNEADEPITIEALNIGFLMDITDRKLWTINAIPFRILPNGREYSFSIADMQRGIIKNPTYSSDCKFWPQICDADKIRSEAWFIGTEQEGIMVVKYNPTAIEYSLIQIQEQQLRFGGADFSLYHEPQNATSIGAHTAYQFGLTLYHLITSTTDLSVDQQCCLYYTAFLTEKGHAYPLTYDPLVHWNELYDVGWYHSNASKLQEFYTHQALLDEAAKAQQCHAETLYLDPGWEVGEGMTIFDEQRLGTPQNLIAKLNEFNLHLAFRTILRDYKQWVPEEWIVEHPETDEIPFTWAQLVNPFQEPCLCNTPFFQEKLTRICNIAKAGVSFMMFDEMDWRGPCFNSKHTHNTPSTAADHANAVFDLCQTVRKTIREENGYDPIIEAHDPVWPWANRYCPSYYRQGFGPDSAYQENWGFEFMWNCIKDLHSGKALMLYYYAFANPIPLYLHITMSHDNSNCLFFWWAASTVRHLGIGGKTCNASVCQTKMNHSFDQEEQFARYQDAMAEYQQYKPWFVIGKFFGVAEDCHIHTVEGSSTAVILLFNLDLTEQNKTFTIPLNNLPDISKFIDKPKVYGSESWEILADDVNLTINCKFLSECCVRIYFM